MFTTLAWIAALSFLAHVLLLVASFKGGQIDRKRYFWSHATLWLAGIVVFSLALLFSGSGQSAFIDYFDTLGKKLMILGVTISLSLAAHMLVTRLLVKSR